MSDDSRMQSANSNATQTASRNDASVSFWQFCRVLRRRGVLFLGFVLAVLFLALTYGLVAPRQYEAKARIEMRTASASALRLDGAEPVLSSSLLSAPMALETTAGILRSDQLAWNTIVALKMDRAPGFSGRFANKFPGFHAENPSPEARAWLIDRFHKRLHVQSVPRTLLIEIRFRSRDAALSAAVVNTLIRAYGEQEIANRQQATAQSSVWLGGQLESLKSRVDQDQQKLDAFRAQHGVLSLPESAPGAQTGESDHNAALVQIDELSRQMASASADRILAEAEFHAASQGDPELVIASDPRLQSVNGGFPVAVLQQIHARRSDLEQERAQLSAEHGPNFPRVVEIGRQLQNLDAQKKAEDARLIERFRSVWQTAAARELLVRKNLDQATAAGLKFNNAATAYARMRQEADSSHDLYVRVLEKSEEAGLSAGVHSPGIAVIDPAFPPAKPSSPDLFLLMPIALFAGFWLAIGAVLVAENIKPTTARATLVLLLLVGGGAGIFAQAPTPSTSGLPTGVARMTPTQDNRLAPNAKEAPPIWNAPAVATTAGNSQPGTQFSAPMPAPLGPNDFLDISEYHTPEFHSAVRVSVAGTVTLPMIGEVHIGGLGEQQAARAIEAALAARGMLLHPLVSVLVLSYSGQDVSVLGEVAHPGVYPFTVHHRLLDLLSTASGLSPSAGRLVNIFHRDDPKTPHAIVLDPSGSDTTAEHNPELSPGDTVQVSRAGLVYVIGDVIRPGGFPVDPSQGLTVVQALSLAWGPSQNAATTKGLLIREQNGNRTITTLNLKRMLRGQIPDQPIYDRDILFIPNSATRNVLNRTLESAIQSAIGVTIYSGLVYSQRY